MRGPILIAGVLATSTPAWAKYDPCGVVSAREPAGRAPRNAKLWLWNGGRGGCCGEQMRIRGAGLDRPLAPPSVGSGRGLAAFDPGLLEGDASYELAVVGAGYAWTFGELATGDEIDLLPPRPPRFRALAITQLLDPRDPVAPAERAAGGGVDYLGGFGAGVPPSDIETALELPDDAVALDVTFDDAPGHFIMPPDAPGMLGYDRCGPTRRFRVGARVCMSIRAIDLAGNRSDAATRCATVEGQLADPSRLSRLWYERPWSYRRRAVRGGSGGGGPGGGGLALAALGVLAGWIGWRLASRRLPAAHPLP